MEFSTATPVNVRLGPENILRCRKRSRFYAEDNKQSHGRKESPELVTRQEVAQPGITNRARDVACTNCMLNDHA
jgi:hypothetical protein